MMQETVTMTCSRCGDQFSGDPISQPLGNRVYCSIACEEGRSPLPEHSPESPRYASHLSDNPRDLIGRCLTAVGLKRTCYSPDWHRDPSDYAHSEIVSLDVDNEILVYESEVFLGKVVKYDPSFENYMIEHENMETGEMTYRWVDKQTMLDQIRDDRWWAE
jgi:hypothetical protein